MGIKALIALLMSCAAILMPAFFAPVVDQLPPMTLEITFLDVGQGDAALIRCGDAAMLVDGGGPEASRKIYSFLRETEGLTHLDCIVATHPHNDHIGGIAAALNAVTVDRLLTPVLAWDTPVFADMLRYAEAQGTALVVPETGDSFDLGAASVTILHCWPEAWSVNDMSICLRVDYGATSFLFTGDAEWMAENMMVETGLPLRADVLKLGHHGSEFSTSLAFLRAVAPRWAVCSCGAGNPYGHPQQGVLSYVADIGAQICRTDLQGDITMLSDGTAITMRARYAAAEEALWQAPAVLTAVRAMPETAMDEGEEQPAPLPADGYVGNSSRKRFHLPGCSSVTKMSEKNKVFFATREEAVAAGYTPCGNCKP